MQIKTRDLQFTIKQARNIVFLKWGWGGGGWQTHPINFHKQKKPDKQNKFQYLQNSNP